MVFFTLIFSLINHVQADPPSARLQQQDLEIQKQCAETLKRGGQVSFDKCISEKGKEAEAERQAALGSNPEDKEPLVCRADEAVRFCESARSEAAKKNNPSAKDHDVQEALTQCRSACNPNSAENQRNFLSGCGSSAKTQRQKMFTLMDKCGYAISSNEEQQEEEKTPTEKSLTESLLSYVPENIKVGAKKVSLHMGFGELVGAKNSNLGSFARESSIGVGSGVEYVKISDQNGEEYKYRSSVDGSLHDSFDDAQLANRRAAQKLVGSGDNLRPVSSITTTAERLDAGSNFEDDSESNSKTNLSFGDKFSGEPHLDYTLGTPTGDPSPDKTSVKPVASPNRQERSQMQNNNETNLESFPPPTSQQPIYQQAAANGAYLQNTLNSPVGAAASIGSGSAVNVSDSGEVSRSGSSSAYGNSSSSGAISFDGFGRPIKTVDNTSGGPARGAGVTPSIASPGGGAVVPSVGISSASFGPGGRLMASNRSASGFDNPAFRSESFRSDSFYKTNGKGSVSGFRLAQTDPNCKPTKKNPCAMTRVAIVGNEKKNCDGKPECILYLTGKLKISKSLGFAKDKSSATRGERGVASVVDSSSPEKVAQKLPEGVWRGYIDVLAHMNNLGASYLKLDHEGFLSTTDE